MVSSTVAPHRRHLIKTAVEEWKFISFVDTVSKRDDEGLGGGGGVVVSLRGSPGNLQVIRDSGSIEGGKEEEKEVEGDERGPKDPFVFLLSGEWKWTKLIQTFLISLTSYSEHLQNKRVTYSRNASFSAYKFQLIDSKLDEFPGNEHFVPS